MQDKKLMMVKGGKAQFNKFQNASDKNACSKKRNALKSQTG